MPAQTCWAPCNQSVPHCGPGQVPVRWAMSATGSCSRLHNTQSAAPATLPCSGTCAGARPFALSHQAYCAGPMAVLTRFVSLSSPWGLSVSRALPLLFSSPHRQSFLSVDHCDLSCETACKRACHSFFGIACQALSHSFLRAASANQQQQSFIASARPVGIAHSLFLPAFPWFLGSSLDETSIDQATYLFDQLSLVRGLCLWKRKATTRRKNKTTKKTKFTY